MDVKMEDKSTEGMRAGVESSDCVIAIITGPALDPDNPAVPPEANAYFNRPFCVSELRWAIKSGIKIIPVVRVADKGRVGELMALAPPDLKCLSNIEFVELIRSDADYLAVGVQKILKAAAKVDWTVGEVV